MKKILSLISCAAIIAASVTSFSGCGNKNDSNQLKVGLECAYPPFNWTQIDDSNGAVKISGTQEFAGGYDVEIAKKIAEGMGKELVIVKTEWDGLPQGVQSGVLDVIIAGMSPTEERKKTIDFSDNYYKSDLILVVKKGSKYENAKTIQDFSGAKVTAQLNTFHYTVIDQINGVKKEAAMDNFPAMRVALESGMIDAYVAEKPEGISIESANPTLTYVSFDEGTGFEASEEDTAIAVGYKKGNKELGDQINKILAGISEEERIELMDNAIKNQPVAQE